MFPSAVQPSDIAAGVAADIAAGIAAQMACPRCSASPLSIDPAGVGAGPPGQVLRCTSCDSLYPQVGGVPCVIRDPEDRIQLWREHLGAFHVGAEQTVEMLEQECTRPGILPTTRIRLTEQARLTRRVLDEVDALLVGAIGTPRQPTTGVPGFESRESLRSLQRDWGWHDSDENARALACVEKVISAPLGRTLVLGAGGCRLAYDLAGRDKTAVFVALDDDPLVLIPAARILRGETLSLTEARPLATEMTLLSAVRELRAPHGPMARVFPLLADGLSPPFRAGAFDTVITPWFVDVVPSDLRDLMGSLRRVLSPGGRWLHFGPLLYPPERAPACRFSREELLELAQRAGFSVEATVSEMLPFSVSPLGEQVRIEPCLAFWARVGDVPPDPPGQLPSWIVLPHLPVPDFVGRALFFHDSPGFRTVVHLIDGTRSIDEIVSKLDAPAGADPSHLKDAVRQCLIENHPDCC